MFNFSKYCGVFHCCTTLASVVGTLTVTIHQKLKSHVITLSPQVVTTSLNSQPLEHRKKHRKEREKEKRHQQPPQTSAEIKTQDMQLSNLNLHRAIEHANTTRLCTGHTHARSHSHTRLVSRTNWSHKCQHGPHRSTQTGQQPITASSGKSCKLTGQRKD